MSCLSKARSPAPGGVDVRENGDTLEFTGKGWKRTVKLVEGALSIEQSTATAAGSSDGGKRGNVVFSDRAAVAVRVAVYRLN